jgi:N-methylhydantoinase A
LNPDYFLGGEMELDIGAAREAVGRLAGELKQSLVEAAAAIHRVVNENMAGAARMHAVERGRDLRRFALVATGGAGPVHAWGVARGVGIRTLLFPPSAGVASAFGMLTANPGFEFARSLPSPLASTPWKEVRKALKAMIEDGSHQLDESGVDRKQIQVAIASDVRHRGQGDAVTVELGPDLGKDPEGQIEEAFEDAYVRLYGRRPPGVESEVMTWRVRVSGPAPGLDVRSRRRTGGRGAARKDRRRAWFPESGFVEVDVFDRYTLAPGAQIVGPAILEETESTVVIGPDARGKVSPHGSLEVEIR